ncbi:hypothetical protein ASPCAL00861 [Aspergillus calidoustus]|uniref:Uncharacterized protein n=1 Tax=Aspergillus calidoustus TaxID=454130 RepID=A0A0U5C294_ASPCI|nr:hypothetical protein ASPCAL00861 [Aspergillus calidoustus]
MSPELAQVPFSYSRSRPRAATERAQALGPPTISKCQSPDVAGQSGEHGRARAASGSLRQPKPLSPSDIHSILEQEQEAMVNRLSRELTLLRNQTASVASTTSSTSTSFNDSHETLYGSTYISGPVYPTASRRHRSSSSLSASYFPVIQGSRASGRSRRPSLVSPQRSQSLISVTSQPHERRHDPSSHVAHSARFRRSSLSQQRALSGPAVLRADEIASRVEMESLKNENEILRRRIRDLELELNVQNNSSA